MGIAILLLLPLLMLMIGSSGSYDIAFKTKTLKPLRLMKLTLLSDPSKPMGIMKSYGPA